MHAAGRDDEAEQLCIEVAVSIILHAERRQQADSWLFLSDPALCSERVVQFSSHKGTSTLRSLLFERRANLSLIERVQVRGI